MACSRQSLAQLRFSLPAGYGGGSTLEAVMEDCADPGLPWLLHYVDLDNDSVTSLAQVAPLPDSLEFDSDASDSEQSKTPTEEPPPPPVTVNLPWDHRGSVDRMTSPRAIKIDTDIKPGEFVLRTLFVEFTLQAEKKIDCVLAEPLERPLSKSLQRGEDPHFDQLLSGLNSVAEHCLPSLLRTLFSWYERQFEEDGFLQQQRQKVATAMAAASAKTKGEPRVEKDYLMERRDLAVDFIFCLVLIEVLKMLPVHPGHDELILHIEDMALKHFKYKDASQLGPYAVNHHVVADLYAEVIGVLAQSRFHSVKRKFIATLKELRSKEQNPYTTHSIISLLMGMKFFRIKMVPIEEFEASFQFMQELATYFVEVKERDIKHSLAGLFVEILVPVAATVKNEVNVPVLKNFVEMLYPQTIDMSTKKKHILALFPLVTCLLCVSQRQFFFHNWPYFLAMCLSHLKNKDQKMSRVALESLYRLLWVYMVRIRCESNEVTRSRLHTIVNSLFPKGSKVVIPRDTPLNIFVKIIQFIAKERLDFAMKDIIFDLLCVGRSIKFLTPERMSIGLRAFLVIADSLQQKEGDPPMPRTLGVLPSGNTLRVKKTFLNKMLTDDIARTIGMAQYYQHVRKAFDSILRALDLQVGRTMVLTNSQNLHKDPEELITGERKPKIDLFRTCVAAIPRLIPEGMSKPDLVDLLSRLTVHMDEELRGLAFQSLQNMVLDFPEWREDVIYGFIQFIQKEASDTSPQLLDNSLRMLVQLVTQWRTAAQAPPTHAHTTHAQYKDNRETEAVELTPLRGHEHSSGAIDVLCFTEGFALVMLCHCRHITRKLSMVLLKEVKSLYQLLDRGEDTRVIDAIDAACPTVVERLTANLPPTEKALVLAQSHMDLQWLAERNNSIWICADSNSHTLNNFSRFDAWSTFLTRMLERNNVVAQCDSAVRHAWPIVYSRLMYLFTYVDPNSPVNDNRASLLRTSKKQPNERDLYLNLWRNYLVFACSTVPGVQACSNRSASPELSSSPESSTSERSEGRFSVNHGPPPPASGLFKLLVPLLRCENAEMRDIVIRGLGVTNADGIHDLMEELLPLIREAIDRKQENMRRRRRRDTLRVVLVRLLELIAENERFAHSSGICDKETNALFSTFVDYIDGARMYLDSESDKDVPVIQEIRLHFSGFICKLIKSFPLSKRENLLTRDLRYSLFHLFANWSGRFGVTFGAVDKRSNSRDDSVNELEVSALQAMSAVLCCGPAFDANGLSDETGYIYAWLDNLLEAHNEKTKKEIYRLAQETIVLLLEFNADTMALLDWVIDRCYTGTNEVADGCFMALARVFSTREYPCDMLSMLNVTLLNTGCPRVPVHETALQLLQLIDKRFFADDVIVYEEKKDEDSEKEAAVDAGDSDARHGRESSLNDVLLAATYSRSQLYLSEQLARLHPDLTMPMFSEVTQRFQTAKQWRRQLLLQYLLPWLYNLELVDPNLPPVNPLSSFLTKMQEVGDEFQPWLQGEGWGSAQATEMVLNNLFYITVKFGDDHQREIEMLWACLCACWPNNLRIIIRYLFIVSGMAPTELLPYAKRVVIYMARLKSDRLLDELMQELQTVETLNSTVERTETPPFYRLMSLRKVSMMSEESAADQACGITDSPQMEKGTLHTKRHSAEDPSKDALVEASVGSVSISESNQATITSHDSAVSSTSGISTGGSSAPSSGKSTEKQPLQSAEKQEVTEVDNFTTLRRMSEREQKKKEPQPYPLPMPAYGGYFSPLREFLPENLASTPSFHRCSLAVNLLTDLLVDGVEVDWSIHLPLMLHMVFLGLDHSRPLVHEHCKKLLLNLLIVLSGHNDHHAVARILLANRHINDTFILTTHSGVSKEYNFIESPEKVESGLSSNVGMSTFSVNSVATLTPESVQQQQQQQQQQQRSVLDVEEMTSVEEITLSLVDFIASRKSRPMWSYEDITSKTWSVTSCEQMEAFLKHIVRVFRESLPHAALEQRWAQVALQVALSCSSRHYAGRSFQLFRALRVPLTSRMLSEILSRLIETVAEQGEDMQGYVTEIMLTLEASVANLDADFRPIDYKELFKSTPNLNNRFSRLAIPLSRSYTGHPRSASYSVSYATGQKLLSSATTSPTADKKIADKLKKPTEIMDSRKSTNMCRSRSAQSLKMMTSDQGNQDDKLSILSQMFWIAVSLLESDYEHEFCLAIRLLTKILKHVQLDRPDYREKLDKILQQLKWKDYPGVQALLLKGCTSPVTYEPTLVLLSELIIYLDCPIVDPSCAVGFPMNVMALLPYMSHHYESPNQLCVDSAEAIAQMCLEKSKKLENLGTVMTLYSRRTFSKEYMQWTKCVVKYLHDNYENLSLNMISFLMEVLEKGPSYVQVPIMNIIYCMLHYIDINSPCNYQAVNEELIRCISRHLDGSHWKEASKILKLVVTKSSSLVAIPPKTKLPASDISSIASLSSHTSFAEAESIVPKKELPGRTMDFSFDITTTPIAGRKYRHGSQTSDGSKETNSLELSPGRSSAVGQNGTQSGWKRPHLSQPRTRERLVNLLTVYGERVGLTKSPSVIFSQNSDIAERQSSMCSSSEEMSPNEVSLTESKMEHGGSTDNQFGVFKDFDFLDIELESAEDDTMDNFNWGVRRRSLSNLEGAVDSLKESSLTGSVPCLVTARGMREESSDDELHSVSPVDEVSQQDLNSSGAGLLFQASNTLMLERMRESSPMSESSHSVCSDRDIEIVDLSPMGATPVQFPGSPTSTFINIQSDEVEDTWRLHVCNLMADATATTAVNTYFIFVKLFKETRRRLYNLTRESCHYLSMNEVLRSISAQFLTALEVLCTQAECPFIFIDADTMMLCSVLEQHKFCVLEIQEHFETYSERREHAVECLDGIKSSLKLQSLGETMHNFSGEEQRVEMCRSLYKLHFQLLLLFQSFAKLISLLQTGCKLAQISDFSRDVSCLQQDLRKAIHDLEHGHIEHTSPLPPLDLMTFDQSLAECNLAEQLCKGKLIGAVKLLHTYRSVGPCEMFGNSVQDDMDVLLSLYCRQIGERKSGVAATQPDHAMEKVCSRLLDIHIQLSSSIKALEQHAKVDREVIHKATIAVVENL